jgi:hypothetical protein
MIQGPFAMRVNVQHHAAPRRGRVPTWLPLGLFACGVGLAHDVFSHEIAGYDLVDPARLSIVSSAPFVDPRWREALAARLAAQPVFQADDAAARTALADAVAALPFVAHVEPPRLLWPDGAVLELVFERPVACLRRGGVFYTVSDRGAVLPGGWSAPPELDGLPLPVIGRFGVDESESPPGGVLGREGLWHALSVVLSMERHLDRDARAALGIVVVDGDLGATSRVDEPGAKLHLEGRRVVYFGRSPDVDAPGDLPEANKWNHVEDALDLAARGELDWRAIDVRWDAFAALPRELELDVPLREEWKSAEAHARAKNEEPRPPLTPRANPASGWLVPRVR